MDTFNTSILTAAIDLFAPLLLIAFAVVTITCNFAAKRLFESCGLHLRARYRAAALIGALGVALAIGERSEHASLILIVVLVGLSALAWRAGSARHGAVIAVISTALLLVEVAAGGVQ